MKLRTSIKLLGAVGLAQLIFVGCSASNDESSDESSAASSAGKITIVDVDQDGVPTFVTGNLGAAPNAHVLASSAMATPLAALTPTFHAKASSLVFMHAHTDAIGDTHFRYRQQRDGRDVIGAELVMHVRNGAVYAANGSVRDDLVPNATTPAIKQADAVTAARGGSASLVNLSAGATPDLAYLQLPGAIVLVYRVDVTGTKADMTPVHDTVLVDAVSGTIAGRIPHIHTAENRQVHDSKNTSTTPGTLARSEGQAPTADAVVNGNYDNLGVTYDCYKQLFARDSFDNKGAAFISSVHYGTKYNNAFWDGTQMVYGDGDGVVLANLATEVDVTAHELTHAVTERTSGLIYSGESGGLNESMSDIFGNTCEWFKDGKPAVPPESVWEVGEGVYTPATPGDALRYMDDPTKDGSSLDFWTSGAGNVDVHYSSGISNLAFYLLSHGGSHPHAKSTVVVTGIGIDKASQIFYRANTTIFTSSTNFAAARTATEQAASQLGYSAAEIASVSAAWAAVGVGKVTPPPPTDAGIDAKDSAPPPPPPPPPPDAGSTCSHNECSTGSKLVSGCDPCVTKICAADSFCCATSWDSICVGEVKSICGQTCGAPPPPPPPPPPTDGGTNTCSHPLCTVGSKLTKTCDPCATKICAADSFCCATSWDSICVGEVKSICGQTCN